MAATALTVFRQKFTVILLLIAGVLAQAWTVDEQLPAGQVGQVVTVGPANVVTSNPANTTVVAGGDLTVKAGRVGISHGLSVASGAAFKIQLVPYFPEAPTATPNHAAGTAALSVTRVQWIGGEANITYTWSKVSGPGNVTFSSNESHAAVDPTATFSAVGAYLLQVTAVAPGNIANSYDLPVTINAINTTLALSPESADVYVGNTQAFTANMADQFGAAVVPQPALGDYTWMVSGGGTIADGVFTATTVGGPFTVQATLGSVTDTSSVTVTESPTPPTIIDQPDSLTVLVGETTNFTVVAEGAPPLSYQWEKRLTSGSPWQNISGATNATLSLTDVAFADSGSQYRVLVSNDYPPATPSEIATLTVNKHAQTITFEPLADKTYGDAAFTLTGSASSELPVEYTSSHPAVATITNDDLVTIVGGGTTTITASQPGNDTYLAAESVQRVLTVNRAAQAITFGSLAEKTVGDADFVLTGTISSNETITYTSSDTSVASIVGNVVTLQSPGDITITASHDGNADYLPAIPVEQPLRVNAAVKQSQTISFTLTSPVTLGEGPVQLTATASSGLAVIYSSSDENVTITPQGLLSYEGVGTAQITASQNGNFAFNPATPVILPLQINAPPTPGAPQFSPPPGTYSDTVEVALSTTPAQAVIYFTTDGSDPTTSSSTYTGPITVDRSTQVKAFAVNAAGVAGPSATTDYTIKVVQPVLTPSYGTFAGSISVTATSSTNGAILYYTTGDEAPSPSWQEFPVPLVLSETATLRVMASREGCVSSQIVIGTYTKREPAPPILDPPPGTYFGPLILTMTASPSDLTVWYAQVPLGQTPVTPDPGVNPAQEYTGPIQLNSSAIIRAVSALEDGTEYQVGGWAGGTYTIISIDGEDDGYSLGGGGPLTSAVSPAGIEGQGATEGVTFSASSSFGDEPIGVATVTVTGADSYFANTPLQSASAAGQAQTTSVTVKVRDSSGEVELVTRDVTWTITELNQVGQPDLIIRQGDSIQLAAAGDGPGALLINPGNLQNGFGTLATTSNVPVKVTYQEPGYYYASAWKNGALVGDRKIVVIGLTAGLAESLAAQVDVERSVTIGLQPKGATAMVEVHAADDEVLDVDVTNIDYEGQTITVALTPLDRGLPVMILRASPGGPILAAKVIDEFTLELIKLQAEWPSYGGGSISTQTCVMRPAIPGLKVQSSAMPADFDETTGESISSIFVATDYQSPGSYQIPIIRQRGVIISKPGNFSAEETTTATLSVDYEPGDLWGSLVAVGTSNLDGDEIIDWLFPDINITIAIDKENEFLARRLRYTRPREMGYQNSYIPGRTYANYRYLMPLWAEVTSTSMPTVTQDVYHLLDLSGGAYQWTGLSIPCQPVMFYNPARVGYGMGLKIGGADIGVFSNFQTDAGDVDVTGHFDSALNQYIGTDANGNPIGLRYEISVAGHQYWQQYTLGPPADLTTSHEDNPEGLEIEVATGPRGFASIPIIVNRGGIPISMGYGNYSIPQLSAIVDLYPGTYSIPPFTLTVTGSSGLIVDDNYINDDQELITGGLVSTGGTLNGYYEVYPNITGNLYRLPQELTGSQTPADLIPHYYLLTDYDEHGDSSWLDIFQGGAWESLTINFQRSDTRTNWRLVGTSDNAEWVFTGSETATTKTVNQGTSLAVSPHFEGARDDQSTLTIGSQGVSRFKVTAVGVSQGKGRGSLQEPAEGLVGGLGSVDLEKGNLHLALPVHVDLFPGAPMSVSMHYNLHDYLDCGYGPGWMTNFDTRLLVKGSGHEWTNMVYIHDDGRRLRIPQEMGNIRPGSVKRWEIVIPDEGMHALDMRVGTNLPVQKNGGWNANERFCLRLNNGTSRYFTSDGYLKRVSSLNVPDITVHRDGNGRITHLSDAINRRYPTNDGQFSTVIGSGSIASPINLIPLSAEAAVTVTYAPGGTYKEIERLEVQGTTTASQFKIQGGDGALRYVFGYTDLQDQKIRCVNDVKVSSNGQDEQRTQIARVPEAGLRAKVTVTRSWSGAEEWHIGASGIIDGEYWTYNDVIPPTGPGSRQAFGFYGLDLGTGWAPMASYFSHIGTTGTQFARNDVRFSREGRILSSEVKITEAMSLRKTFDWKRLIPEGGPSNDIPLSYLSEEVIRGLTGMDDIPLADILVKTNLFSDVERFGMVKSLQNAGGFSRNYAVNRKDPYPREVVDERQNVWKNGDRNKHGQPQTVESPENYVSEITYDDDKYSVSSATTGFGYRTGRSTDTRGLALETTLPGGAKRTRTYDPFGRVTWMIDEMEREVSIEYDVLGNVRKKTFVPGPSDDDLPSGIVPEEITDYAQITGASGIHWKVTTYKAGAKTEENIYDAVGRLVEKKIPRTMVNGNPAVVDCSTTYIYHPTSGFLQSVNVAAQSETTFEHDLVGNVKTITSAMGIVRSFERNALGWVTRESIGSGASQLSTWTTYTRSGAVARTVNAAGGWTAAGFDEMGNVIGQRTSEGKRVTRKFDKDGRLFQVSHPGGDIYTLEYDPSGEGASLALQIKTKRNEETNPITTMELNHTGAHRKTYNLVNGETFVTTYERRDDGSERTVSIPGLQTITIGRDGFGRTVEKRQRAVANGPELTNKTIFSGTGDAIGQSTAHGHTQSVVLVPNTGEVNETHHNAIGADPQALVRDSAVLKRDERGNILESAVYTDSASQGGEQASLVTKQTYDADDRVISRLTPDGVKTVWHYDGVGRVELIERGQETGPLTPLVHYTYNQLGNVTSVTDNTGRMKSWTYDTLGNRTSETVGSDTTTYVYNPDTNALATVIHPDGKTTRYIPDGHGRLGSVINPRGFEVVYAYDDLDRVVTVTRRPAAGATDPDVLATPQVSESFTYWADSQRRKTHTDIAGRVTSYFYDGIGRLIRREIQDDNGLSQGDPLTIVYTDYDDQPAGGIGGRKVTTYVGWGPGDPPSGEEVVRTFNRAGALTGLVLPDQDPIALSYDVAGRITTRGPTTYIYKPTTGHLDEIRETANPSRNARFHFDDPLGRLSSITLPHGLSRTFAYDGADRLATAANFIGGSSTAIESWVHDYDAQGRIAGIRQYADGAPDPVARTHYAYRAGRLVSEQRSGLTAISADAAVSANYGYDDNGNRTSIERYENPVAQSEDFSDPQTGALPPLDTGWEVAGGQLAVNLPAPGGTGQITSLTALTLTQGSAVRGPQMTVTVNPVLPASNLTVGTVAAGLHITIDATTAYRAQWRRQYSSEFSPVAEGRLVVEKLVTDGGSTTSTILGISDPVVEQTSAPVVLSLETGSVNVLTASASNAVIGTVSFDCEVDLGPIHADPPPVSLVVTATGDCPAQTSYDDLESTTAVSRTVQRQTYDGLDRLLKYEDLDAAGQPSNTMTYGRDALGRLTNRVLNGTPTVAYAYDALDRTATLTSGSVTTTYGYMGPEWMRRSASPTGQTPTTWTYDDQGITGQTVGSQVASFQRHGGTLLWDVVGTTTRSYALDTQGNVSGIAGTLLAGEAPNQYPVELFLSRFDYDSWGRLVRERMGQLDGTAPVYTAISGAYSSGPRYRGMWYDGGANGLYKTATRFYDPALGQFTQEDPARAGGNWYAYCDGDPVNRTDPSGLDWKWNGSEWKHVDGTPWVKPPPRGLTPDLMGGDDYYNILDHIQVTATMNGLRGPVTREDFMQRLGAQRDYWNSRQGSEQVVRINLAYAAWDHNALGFGDGGSLEGVLQGGIVDNIQAGGVSAAGGYIQAVGYNIWNGFSLGGLGREDRRVGGYNAALISEAQNAAMKSANRKSAAIDVALLAAGGWAGSVASTVRGGTIAVNAAGLTTRTIVAANTVNAGFATFGAYNVYEGVSTGNPVQATVGAVMTAVPVAAVADEVGAAHRTLNARYTWGAPPGGHWTQGMSHQYRTQMGLVGTPTQLHHWLIPQRSGIPNYIKNTRWNLVVAADRAAHARIDTAFRVRGVDPYPLLIRPWVAMPNWARAASGGAVVGGAWLGDELLNGEEEGE